MQVGAPFTWFGGKRSVAAEVWERFGCDVPNYVEPFCGSAAVLLARPAPARGGKRVETINDADGLLTNFWRAVQAAPEAVAEAADWPVSELDLHARHAALDGLREGLTARLLADPNYYDATAAGWWVWGLSAWIGGGWCGGKGAKQIPHLSSRGQSINRVLPAGFNDRHEFILDWFTDLQARLRDVRITCGDWRRVLTKSVTTKHGTTAVFLDPPYLVGNMSYSAGSPGSEIAGEVAQWAVEHGDDPAYRIALCGYQGHYQMPANWICHQWSTTGGYGNQGKDNDNRKREVVWFSPHCLSAGVFDFAEVAR